MKNQKLINQRHYARPHLPQQKHPSTDGHLHQKTFGAKKELKLQKEHKKMSYAYSERLAQMQHWSAETT